MTTDIIYGKLFFIGMLFFPYSIQYNVVHPGPCLEFGSRYCDEKVANSFCLKKKNKCYCKPQFVDLKESYGIACKPRKIIFLSIAILLFKPLKIMTALYVYTLFLQNFYELISFIQS